MAKIGFYEDSSCTKKMTMVTFKDHSINYLAVDGVKQIFNVVPIGEQAESDIYIRNEDQLDIAITKITTSDPEVKVTLTSDGYLRPSNVLRLHVVYAPTKKPDKAYKVSGSILIEYHEIYN